MLRSVIWQKQAAMLLNVSVSTLKRRNREWFKSRWPNNKQNNSELTKELNDERIRSLYAQLASNAAYGSEEMFALMIAHFPPTSPDEWNIIVWRCYLQSNVQMLRYIRDNHVLWNINEGQESYHLPLIMQQSMERGNIELMYMFLPYYCMSADCDPTPYITHLVAAGYTDVLSFITECGTYVQILRDCCDISIGQQLDFHPYLFISSIKHITSSWSVNDLIHPLYCSIPFHHININPLLFDKQKSVCSLSQCWFLYQFWISSLVYHTA
jgi:hypothetical protein